MKSHLREREARGRKTKRGSVQKHGGHEASGSYRAFAIEMAAEFIIMYLVMYTMIATLDHFYANINNVYMTLMMVAPMAVIMLISMRSMFTARRLNWPIGVSAAVLFVASFIAMRTQTGVGDAEFLKSMIPHHSGAILMCEQAALTDPEVIALCKNIVQAQKAEIAAMEAILARH